MKNTNLTSRFRGINHLVIALFLLISPFAGAYAACCSGHGGVASCNKTTGYQMCKDGSASPSCTCTKATKKTTPKTTTKVKTTTTTSNPVTTTTTKTTTSAKGCCSKHGGIAQCDKSTGHQLCKDGTQSPSCACH